MTQELFVFAKTCNDMLKDYKDILNYSLKAEEIKKEWCTYIEFSIEPVGWRAVWKISRDLCTDLKIVFPCTVIVTVQEINFKDLSCTATITEVEDDNVCLPPMMTDIPLVELYPTIDQDNNFSMPKLFETAKIIDCLRFFYNHLWMPWDLDYEDNSWVGSHLENRLNLHFALLERQVPNNVAYAIHRLVTESQKIQKKIEDIEDQMAEDMEVNRFPAILLELTELHNRMSELKKQYAIYENPKLLEAFIKRNQSIEKREMENENSESDLFVVLKTSTSKQLEQLARLTSEYKLIRIFPTLQDALVKVPANASLCVQQGYHPLLDLWNFEVGGTITGMEPGVVLTEDAGTCSGWSLLKGALTLANLTVQMTSVWDIIKVRPGAECNLREVTMEGASVTDAVDVFPGGKLVATNCRFINCRVAVVCDTDTTIVLTNCTFTKNDVAIEVKQGCCLTMENCTISDSKMYGIKVTAAVNGNGFSMDIINSIPDLKESGTVFKSNANDFHLEHSPLKPAGIHSSDGETLSTSR